MSVTTVADMCFCGKPARDFCCGITYYCGRGHKALAWPSHKLICTNTKRINDAPPPITDKSGCRMLTSNSGKNDFELKKPK